MVRRVLDLELLNTRLIRERQEAEDLGDYLRRILDELPQMVVVRSIDGEILFANRAAEVSHGERLVEWGALANHARLTPAPQEAPEDLGGLGQALGGEPFQTDEDDELVEFEDLAGNEHLLFVRERPFPLGGGEMAVLQLGWDAESYMPAETKVVLGAEDRKVKVPAWEEVDAGPEAEPDPDPDPEPEAEPDADPEPSVEDIATEVAEASAPEPEPEAEPELQPEPVEGDLDGDGVFDDHDVALADALAGLDEEAEAQEQEAEDTEAEPGIVEEPRTEEPEEPEEPEAPEEHEDVVFDPFAMALRDSDPPEYPEYPGHPDEPSHSSFADDAVTLSQIGVELDEDGAPRLMRPEDLAPPEDDWEPSDPLASARLGADRDAASDSEVEMDSFSTIFLRADPDDDLSSEAEPLVGPVMQREDEDVDSWVDDLEDDEDDEDDERDDLDLAGIVAALPEEASQGSPDLVAELGAGVPAAPEDGPGHEELAAAIVAFEEVQELTAETPDLPPVEAAGAGTLSRIFEGGDPSGDSIDVAMGGWGIEPPDADAEPEAADAEPAAADGVPEVPWEPPLEDLGPVEDLAPHEAPEPVPDEVHAKELAPEVSFEEAAAQADTYAEQGYAVQPVRPLEIGETSESGTWNMVTVPWTQEEATRVVEAIVAAYESGQSPLAADLEPPPVSEPVEPVEPVFAVDAPGPPDPGGDWGEVEEALESMPGGSPAVSAPSRPGGQVEKPDWAKTRSELAAAPEVAQAVDFEDDDPLATLSEALETDRREAGATPSAPPPQAPQDFGGEGPEWEAELRAQMEAGQLGTKPPEPAIRPNADETEQALWELAHDELGGATEALAALQTQLQTATRRAESAERALEEARREKADVLTYTGNELRTPLEGILGMAELLRGTELAGEQRDMLDSLTQNAQLLYSLLRGIIETATLGSETATQDAVDLFEVIRSVIDGLGGLAETREVVLLRSIRSGVPRMVEGDGDRVRVLLRNLLETALRFLEKGEMELVVSMEGALPSGPMLRFTIHDTGAGLPPELLALLDGTPLPPGFEEATGLGGTARVLSASQEMAVGMDGSIQAETVTGQGAQLFLIMPFRWARRASKGAGLQVAPGEDESLKAATGRVLLVEDNPIARKVTASMLEQLGRAPELAETGEQAVHQVQRNHYGLVLLDTDLPDMGWSEVTRMIRAAEVQAGRRSVLLGLVPHNGPALELCVSEGMDGILDKPVELKYLQDTLERFLGSDFMRVRVRDEPPATSDATRFDPAFLTKQFPSDHRAAYEVLEVFLIDADQLETKLINSVRTGNWPEVVEIGHSLKGVARNVGAARLATLAETMEVQAANGDASAAGGVAGDVKAELAWLRGELAA